MCVTINTRQRFLLLPQRVADESSSQREAAAGQQQGQSAVQSRHVIPSTPGTISESSGAATCPNPNLTHLPGRPLRGAIAHLLSGLSERADRGRLHSHPQADWPDAGAGRPPRGEGQQRRDRAATHEQHPVRRRAAGPQHAGPAHPASSLSPLYFFFSLLSL